MTEERKAGSTTDTTTGETPSPGAISPIKRALVEIRELKARLANVVSWIEEQATSLMHLNRRDSGDSFLQGRYARVSQARVQPQLWHDPS